MYLNSRMLNSVTEQSRKVGEKGVCRGEKGGKKRKKRERGELLIKLYLGKKKIT